MAAVKLAKSAVDFEHPAKGPHHCTECRHFLAPHGCELVRGHINAGDWCDRFTMKRARQIYDHPRSKRAAG